MWLVSLVTWGEGIRFRIAERTGGFIRKTTTQITRPMWLVSLATWGMAEFVTQKRIAGMTCSKAVHYPRPRPAPPCWGAPSRCGQSLGANPETARASKGTLLNGLGALNPGPTIWRFRVDSFFKGGGVMCVCFGDRGVCQNRDP